MNKIVVVGAGKTGRGFIGRLLAEGKQEVLFVDKDKNLVQQLNDAGEFKVHFFGNVREPMPIRNFRAATWENADIRDAELIIVSVGGQNLKDVGQQLKLALDPQKHYTIITAENASKPSQTLREAIGLENISVSEATVFCTTIEKSGLDINSENYPYLQCDADLLEGYVLPVEQIRAIGNFSNFLTRKLYTYNAASCVIAYMGWLYGYESYGDAANDPRILALLDQNYAETNKALCAEFGYDSQDQAEFAQLSKNKFCDRTIEDTVARNARDPQRKLADKERIMGPMRLIYQYGGDSSVLEQTCAAGVLYDVDPNWNALKEGLTWEQILEKYCGLCKGEVLFARVTQHIDTMKILVTK